MGRRIVARCDALGLLSEHPGQVTRTYLTPMHKAANEQVGIWMKEAGMAVRVDPLGTIIGRLDGHDPNSATVLIGSHLDSVRDAGRYDGILGVIAAIEAVEALVRAGLKPRMPIEVAGFGDEEGVRFDSALIGSHAMAGTLQPDVLNRKDRDGIRLADALTAFGLDPKRIGDARKKPGTIGAYLEVHIEQGPVLERKGLPIGVVTAIFGATRRRYAFQGEAGHSGTVPMDGRKDALAGAAEAILAAEAVARTHNVVATVGQIEVEPGAVNVIPGGAKFTLDLRADADGKRAAARADLDSELMAIAKRRGLLLESETFYDSPATPCDPALMALFDRATEAVGVAPLHLPSGAGHDAIAMSRIAPVGMLFVRCKGGISHNPAESVDPEDAGLAALALIRALEDLSQGSAKG